MSLFNQYCTANLELQDSYQETIFYSSVGIFSLKNDTIHKHIYTPKSIETMTFMDIQVYKDTSQIVFKEIFSQLPNDYVCVYFVKKVYTSKNDHSIRYNTVFKEGIMFDCYIEVPIHSENSEIEKSILSFLLR